MRQIFKFGILFVFAGLLFSACGGKKDGSPMEVLPKKIYQQIDGKYAEINDFEKALEHLSAAADHAVKFITEIDSVHSSLILRGMALGSWSTTSPENDAKCLLKKNAEFGIR